MTKREVLQQITFGKRIAEEEAAELSTYFVKTDQWDRIFAGEVDVVYGPKGSGKSAIYSLLLEDKKELWNRGIQIVAGENLRGTPAFKTLVTDPPASENEFCALWKLYFLSLIARVLRDKKIAGSAAKKVCEAVERARMMPREANLRGLLKSAVDYMRALKNAGAFEGGLEIDPSTGLPIGLIGRITLGEPSVEFQNMGYISIDGLFEEAERALSEANLSIWLVLDRLDVAFAEKVELEQNALRALFKVYLDLVAFKHLSLKIFLRSDIWRRITKKGFREASHITRHVTITWDNESLMNLIIRRALRNSAVRSLYNVDEAKTLAKTALQSELFYRLFPAQVETGPKSPTTFDWMLSRTRDGSGSPAPREMIHLLTAAREAQLRKLELGEEEPPEENLFERPSLRDALTEVSRVRLEQTLYAEYPELRDAFEKMEGEKTQHSVESLARLWGKSKEEALALAMDLVEIGFFERRKEQAAFWVPFLYRDALKLVEGSAE